MDELDSAIIARLQQDARQSNRELAQSLGIAASTCLERVRTLRRRGVIRKFTAEVDLPSLGRNVQALVAVQVRPLNRQVISEFSRTVSEMTEVLAVYTLAGGDDFLVHVAVQDTDSLHAFLIDRISARKEVVGFRTSVIYHYSRSEQVLPLTTDR